MVGLHRLPCERFAQVFRETECHGHDGQGRVFVAAGREHRTASDIQILRSVHPAVRVHHALFRIPVHAGGPHMVEGTFGIGGF